MKSRVALCVLPDAFVSCACKTLACVSGSGSANEAALVGDRGPACAEGCEGAYGRLK